MESREILFWVIIGYLLLASSVFIIRWFLGLNYKLNSQQQKEASKHKFVVIGAGFSGLIVAYYFRLMGLNFVLIERGSKVGGTWYWNTYPGIGCDVISHLYSYSDFLNSQWTTMFPYGKEIWEYLDRFFKFADLEKYTEFNTEVTCAKWNEKTYRWKIISVCDGKEKVEEFNWLISCVGGLHRPKYIKIDNDENYKGLRIHTADWPEKLDLTGKKIGIIGTGASAIQILPKLIENSTIKEVVHFQRTAAYCFPRNQTNCGPVFKTIIDIYPFGILYRWIRYAYQELRFFLLWYYFDGPINKLVTRLFVKGVRKAVKDQELAEKLIPTYVLGCKRILVSDNYYSSMNDERYSMTNSPICSMSENGIKTRDSHHELDIVIYATGFDLQENYDFISNHNEKFKEWKESGLVETYYGTFHPGVPNFVSMLGPMVGLGHNSIIFMIECQLQFMINVIRGTFSHKAECAMVKKEIVNKSMDIWRYRIDKSVWSPLNCSSWYQQGEPNGRPWGIWPGTTTEYYFRTRNIPLDHFEYF